MLQYGYVENHMLRYGRLYNNTKRARMITKAVHIAAINNDVLAPYRYNCQNSPVARALTFIFRVF